MNLKITDNQKFSKKSTLSWHKKLMAFCIFTFNIFLVFSVFSI